MIPLSESPLCAEYFSRNILNNLLNDVLSSQLYIILLAPSIHSVDDVTISN